MVLQGTHKSHQHGDHLGSGKVPYMENLERRVGETLSLHTLGCSGMERVYSAFGIPKMSFEKQAATP